MILDLERPPEAPASETERAAEALRLAASRGMLDPSGAVTGGRSLGEVDLVALLQAAATRWDAEAAGLGAAERGRIGRRVALGLTPSWCYTARPAPGEAPRAPAPRFPLDGLLQSSDAPERAFALRVHALTLRAAGLPARAIEALEEAIAACEAVGDRLGAGLGWLWLGDLRAAPAAPLLSGERWLQECPRGTLEISGTPMAPPPGDDAAARAAWARAEEALQDQPWSAPTLDLGTGLLALRAGRTGEARALLDRAIAGFEEVDQPYGLAAARLHGALATTLDGAAPPRALVAEIGRWGAAEGSRSFALGLGLTALTRAHTTLEIAGEPALAHEIARLAVALLDALGLPLATGQALLAESTLARHAWGASAALPPLEAAWARALEPRGGEQDEAAWLLARDATMSALDLVLGGRDLAAIEAQSSRIESLRGWRPEAARQDPLLTSTVTLARAHALLLRVNLAAERGDAPAMEEALGALEGLAAALPEPGALVWRATALRWRDRKEEAATAMLAFLEHAWGGGEPAGASGWDEAVARQRRRDHAVERLSVLASCERWAEAEASLAALDEAWGPEGWLEPDRPWQGRALRAEVLDGAGRLAEAAESWARAWEAVEARLLRLVGDAGRAALTGDRGVYAIGRGGARTALLRRAAAQEAGDEAEAARLLSEAFTWSERVRARALLELLERGEGSLGPTADAALRAWSAARTRLAASASLLAQAEDEARRAALSARVEEDQRRLDALGPALAGSPVLARLRASARPRPLEEILGDLPAGSCLLAFDAYDTGLVRWALPAGGAAQVHRVSLERLRLPGLARRFREACARGEDPGGPGAALAALLLEGLDPLLATRERLYVAPSGPLHRVPFPALPWRGRPLLETHTISVVPSGSALSRLAGDAPLAPLERALIVGDPARMAWRPPGGAPPQPLPRLPGAEAEARAAARAFSAPTLLLGEAATLDAVRAALPGQRVLHLATHGRHEPDAPLLSAVMLADGAALDVAALTEARLDAALVVLSACESGLGEARGGEHFGLARALLAAGAGAVVQSLWPVDDEATATLMQAFYAALARGDSPALALRRAARSLRDAATPTGQERDVLIDAPLVEADPVRLWAPFVLLG